MAWSNVQLLTSRTFLQNMYYCQGIRMAKLLVVKTNIRMNTTSGGEEDYSTVLPPPWDSSPNTQTKVSYLGVGDVCFFLTMRCFPILNDAMF